MEAIDPVRPAPSPLPNATAGRTIDNLQVLRALAAGLIVLFHSQRSVRELSGISYDIGFAAWGVDVFFVISGFIMFHTTMGFRRSSAGFIADRAIRVVPLYWLATLCLYGLFLAGFRPNGMHEAAPLDLFTSLAFLPRELPNGGPVLLSLGWTLIYEFMFYLLFAATFFMKSHARSLAVLCVVFALLGLLGILLPDAPYMLDYFTNTIVFEFLLGAAFALVIHRLPSRPSPPIALAAGCAIVLGIAAIVGVQVHDLGASFGWDSRALRAGLPALALVGGAITLDRMGFAMRSPPLLLLGAASYSLYLFHPFVLQPAMKICAKMLEGNQGLWVAFTANAFAFALCCAVAIAIHLVVERPMIRALKGWRAGRPDQARTSPEPMAAATAAIVGASDPG
jgi:exopolysaccharide production protein ExoZ